MIRIIAVGKIKEAYLTDALQEYTKRLSAYTNLEIIQVQDEKCGERLSEKEADQVKKKEGERILKYIKDTDYVITLEIEGRQMTSEELSGFIEGLETGGRSNIDFVIGGSIGLHRDVSARSDYRLSFSKMTFPHQLMRVILLEQIYRAYKIMKGEPYHK